MAMSLRDFRVLEKTMMQTTSTNDAEALNALRAANALLAKYNYTWADAFARLVKVDGGAPEVEDGGDTLPQDRPAPARRDPDQAQIEEAFGRLERVNLPSGTEQFITSLKEQWDQRGSLSPKQKSALFRNLDQYA